VDFDWFTSLFDRPAESKSPTFVVSLRFIYPLLEALALVVTVILLRRGSSPSERWRSSSRRIRLASSGSHSVFFARNCPWRSILLFAKLSRVGGAASFSSKLAWLNFVNGFSWSFGNVSTWGSSATALRSSSSSGVAPWSALDLEPGDRACFFCGRFFLEGWDWACCLLALLCRARSLRRWRASSFFSASYFCLLGVSITSSSRESDLTVIILDAYWLLHFVAYFNLKVLITSFSHIWEATLSRMPSWIMFETAKA